MTEALARIAAGELDAYFAENTARREIKAASQLLWDTYGALRICKEYSAASMASFEQASVDALLESPVYHWVLDDLAPDAIAAHDAYEAGDAQALALMVGLPACISIGSDTYAARVVASTHTTLTAEYTTPGLAGKHRTFRLTKRGWTSGPFHLAVGLAETRLSREF